MQRRLVIGAGLAGLATFPFPALAQAGYPAKVITMVVPYPAGGGSDVNARIVAPELGRQIHQTVIVENVSGASGSLGVQRVINTGADGYSVLLGTPMELMLTPVTLSAARYKPEDFRLVSLLTQTSMVLLARKELEASSADELVALLRSPRGKELSYGSIGPGSLYHLLGERFCQQTGTKMLHVPYKGMAPLLQDMMGNQIDVVFMPMAGNVPDLIESGKLKALGIAAAAPHERFGAIPLLKNSQGLGDFVYTLWSGVQVTRNVPESAQEKLNAALNQTLLNPEVRRSIEQSGAKAAQPATLAELRRIYQADTERYRALAKSVPLQQN